MNHEVAIWVERVWRALGDLMKGLFGLPNQKLPAGTDYAAEVEARYRHPRRCC